MPHKGNRYEYSIGCHGHRKNKRTALPNKRTITGYGYSTFHAFTPARAGCAARKAGFSNQSFLLVVPLVTKTLHKTAKIIRFDGYANFGH